MTMPTKQELAAENSELLSAIEDALESLDDGQPEEARQILMDVLDLEPEEEGGSGE